MQKVHEMKPQGVVEEINLRLEALSDAGYDIEDDNDPRIITFLDMSYTPSSIKLGPILKDSDAVYTFELLQIPSAAEFDVEIGEQEDKDEPGTYYSYARSYLVLLRGMCQENGVMIQVTPNIA